MLVLRSFLSSSEKAHAETLCYVGWAGGSESCSPFLFDMLDGQVARLGNLSPTFGALYDFGAG